MFRGLSRGQLTDLLSSSHQPDDYPDLFIQSLRRVWAEAAAKIPNIMVPNEPLLFSELVLDENNDLQEVQRPPGSNSCGMVAWIFTMRAFCLPSLLPSQCDDSDVGSLACYIQSPPSTPRDERLLSSPTTSPTRSDRSVPLRTTTSSRPRQSPRSTVFPVSASSIEPVLNLEFRLSKSLLDSSPPGIYLSANSGARLGIAEELLNLFQAAFNDANDPLKGVKYLYL